MSEELEQRQLFPVLTPAARQAWYEVTADNFANRMVDKAMKGQIEHNCDLGTYTLDQLLKELENELIDAAVYMNEIRRRVAIMKAAGIQYEQSNAKSTTTG